MIKNSAKTGHSAAHGIMVRNINWRELEKKIAERGKTKRELSLIMGKYENYLSVCKGRDAIERHLWRILLNILGIEDRENDFLFPEDNKQDTKDATSISHGENKELYELRDELQKIKAALSRMIEEKPLVRRDTANSASHGKYSSKDKAVELLLICLGSNGRCKREDFVKGLVIFGIGAQYEVPAIEQCGYVKKKYGYGNNAVTWIEPRAK